MTTAHRPTFDPARGKEAQRGPAYHQRLLPAHMTLKHRQTGQGTTAETEVRDLRAELLKAEAAHFSKKNISATADEEDSPAAISSAIPKRMIEDGAEDDASEEDDRAAKRRKILEEAREIDAESESDSSESSESSDEDDDDEEDETAELMRELEKIKRERAEAKAKEEAERAAQEQEQREYEIARGNPLLNPRDFNVKRRWDDDVVFRHQARGTETKTKKEFVNDLLRSDFHKRFMSKYVR